MAPDPSNLSGKTFVAIIPARYRSSRFPGKPLVSLLGTPMVIHTLRIAAAAIGIKNTYAATDDERIARVVIEHGFTPLMTDGAHPTGTDRIREAADRIDADFYLNVQGDEPMVDPADIIKVAEKKLEYPDEVICGMAPLGPDDDPADRAIPKVVADDEQRLVYFSRAVVPGKKEDGSPHPGYWRQVCIYAFTKKELVAFADHGRVGSLEKSEDIELLRFVEMGIPVRMVRCAANSRAVDRPEDVAKVEAELRAQGKS